MIIWPAVLGILGGLAMTALGDMVGEEVRDRLDHLPQAILRLAGRQVDPAKREAIYDDEWLPELTFILKGDEARPISRLFRGTGYALGILINARRIARHLSRPAPGQPASPSGQAAPESPRLGPIRPMRLLITLAGARPEVLACCPGEQKKFMLRGFGLLVASAVASASAWLALTAAGVSPVLTSVAAPVWGVINLGLDRWLIISMTGRRRHKLLIAVPRFLLALALAAIISLASALTFFPSQVRSQVMQVEMLAPQNRPMLLSFLNQSAGPEIQAQQDERLNLAGVSQIQKTVWGKPGQSVASSDQKITSLTDMGIDRNVETLCGDACSITVEIYYSRNGPLLPKLQALHQLSVSDAAVGTTLALAGLLELMFGCLPLMVRLAQRAGLYEEFAIPEVRPGRKRTNS